MSVEGGIRGNQHRFVCGTCGKVFFAWRPDTAPGVKIKCYFCKAELEDEAARRPPVAAPAPATPPDAATTATPAPAPVPNGPPAQPAMQGPEPAIPPPARTEPGQSGSGQG